SAPVKSIRDAMLAKEPAAVSSDKH
ncbi:MAG: hypothetical protein JWP37_2601, partial [Mucilaginibacter sp.]|nr:hypothetical protein [Mucilaginibacter sp.]